MGHNFSHRFNVIDVHHITLRQRFPARHEVTSQGHCFPSLYGLHEKRPFSPAAPQYTECDPHKTVKSNRGLDFALGCLYTHHMSLPAECHYGMVRTSTSSVGAPPLYNVSDGSFFQQLHQYPATPQCLRVTSFATLWALKHATEIVS